jgi:hypothetical protein
MKEPVPQLGTGSICGRASRVEEGGTPFVNESVSVGARFFPQRDLSNAYALQGDTSKARTAYQDFLALWKDADPNIPILQQAKSEYAKLK